MRMFRVASSKFDPDRKKQTKTNHWSRTGIKPGSVTWMNKLVPPAVKRAHSDADQEKCGREGLRGMQGAAAAISPRCGIAGEAGVWPGRVTWEFWMWMVPGGSACVNTCPCDVTMATGWYRVPPEGIICRLWVSSGLGSYRQQPPPPTAGALLTSRQPPQTKKKHGKQEAGKRLNSRCVNVL